MIKQQGPNGHFCVPVTPAGTDDSSGWVDDLPADRPPRARLRCGSVAQSCPTLCDPTDCSTSGFAVLHHLWSLLKLQMPSDHLIFCHPSFLPPSIFPSIRIFFNELIFTSGGQCVGSSASALVLPMNIQG